MSDPPPQPPQPPETELSQLQDAWEAAIVRGDREGAAVLLAHAALEYVEQAAGPVGDGLGGGIIPLWGKAPRGSDWTTSGVGGLGGRGGQTRDEILELFKSAGEAGADGIGVVCGYGLLVIDIDDWVGVTPELWAVLHTGHMASSRKSVEDQRAHIGWRVGPEHYVHTMAGFDDLGPAGWKAGGVGELRSSGGHIRIWGGGVGTNVAARDPQWFVDLPRAGVDVLTRLTVKPAAGGRAGAPGIDIYSSDLWEWLDGHSEERVVENHGAGWSEQNLDKQLEWFAETVHGDGLPKYTAALRASLKLAVDVAAEAVGGRMAYDGLYEAYRQAGLDSGDWDERSRRPAYERMWRGAVSRILDGSMDDKVRKSADTVGNPLVIWRPGLGGTIWEPRLDVDPETGEIYGGGSSDPEVVTGPELQSSGGGAPELAGQPVQVAPDTIGVAADLARAAIDREVAQLVPVDDDGFMPSEQLLPDSFWESRGVLSFIRRWAWTREGWPDAVLMGLLAGLGAALPCELVIDPSRATPSPLTLFVLGIDQSGAGKSRNQTLGMKLLREFTGDFGPVAMGQTIELPLGTAEGVVAKFFKKRDRDDLEADKKALRELATSDGWSREELLKKLAEIEVYTRKVKGVVIMADEAKGLMEIGSLGGAGLATMLLTAWSGKGGLVSTYKNTTDLPQFKPMSYRMSMNAAIQTSLAHRLMAGEQADSGFAQRLLVFPLNNNWTAYKDWVAGLVREWVDAGREVDPDPEVAAAMAIEEAKDWVDLELAGSGSGRAWAEPAWTSGMVDGLESVADGDVEGGELWRIRISRDSGWLKAQLADRKMRFEDRQGDPLDAHTLFNQLRVAALLAVLDVGWAGSARRSVEVVREDWELAGQIVDCTRANRSWLGRVAERERRKVQSDLARDQVIREAELVLHEDELSEEGFVNDLRQHMLRFHEPSRPKFRGEICRAACWFNAGQSRKRKERLAFWKSKGYFRMVSEGAEGEDPAWFPVEKVPGVVRIRYRARGEAAGGWLVSGAVWYTQVPVAGGEAGIVIHPEDEVG